MSEHKNLGSYAAPLIGALALASGCIPHRIPSPTAHVDPVAVTDECIQLFQDNPTRHIIGMGRGMDGSYGVNGEQGYCGVYRDMQAWGGDSMLFMPGPNNTYLRLTCDNTEVDDCSLMQGRIPAPIEWADFAGVVDMDNESVVDDACDGCRDLLDSVLGFTSRLQEEEKKKHQHPSSDGGFILK